MIRHCYTFRTKTHYGQLLKKESFKEAYLFINEIRSNRLNNGISNCIIGNMDETPIFLNMPISETIFKKGSKQVINKTKGQKKFHVSCMLCILVDGDKLPPLVIFKAKNKEILYKNLFDDPNIKIGKIFIEYNSASEEIIDRWFKKIWYKYLKCEELTTESLGYLILDKAIFHVTDKIINTYRNSNIFLSFITSELTRYLQLLDVIVNKPFKEAL